MHLFDGQLIHSATDVATFLGCDHASALDLAVVEGRLPKPNVADDPFISMIGRKGDAHELAYLAELQQKHQVAVIDKDLPLAEAVAQTVAALDARAEVIFQAAFLDADGHRGHADFLIRTDEGYDVVDTKIASSVKVPALLQMAAYGRHLIRLTGIAPRNLTVVPGKGEPIATPFVHVSAYAAHVQGLFERSLATARTADLTTVQPRKPACSRCRWAERCDTARRQADDVTLVPDMTAKHRLGLRAIGVTTIAQLAQSTDRYALQARLMIASRESGEPVTQLLPVPAADPTKQLVGLQRLPAASPGDLFFDLEGHPLAEGGQLEYLWGWVDAAGAFHHRWGHTRAKEQRAFEDFVDTAMASWQRHDDMHVYHYAPYEVTALKRLAGTYRSREDEVDRLLRGGRLVDLYSIVRQSMRIGEESYSIKKLEHFYLGAARKAEGKNDVAGGADSVVEYERWLDMSDDAILENIRAYNEKDCASTLALRDWLEGLRADTGVTVRPELTDGHGPDQEGDAATLALLADLQGGGHTLMADLLEWHKREDRQAWWRYFEACELDEEELIAHDEHLGGVGPWTFIGPEKRSSRWRADFHPQTFKIAVDDDVYDSQAEIPATSCKVLAISAKEGWIEIKVGPGKEPPTCFGLKAHMLVQTKGHRAALREIAEGLLGRGSVPGAAAALLGCVVPSGLVDTAHLSGLEAVLELRKGLMGKVLAVQGPPGAGKTYVGANLIRALVDDGLTVGVTGPSHQVIANLMKEVGGDVRRLQKTELEGLPYETTNDNDTAEAAALNGSADVIGGTTWFFVREGMRAAVDVLVIDEAGQLSLANALAASVGAKAVVLLGDPQQLAQPSQGVHPGDAGRSGLEHVLDGREVMPPDRGVFLDRTWRMHPSITTWISEQFYDSQLETIEGEGREQQRFAGLVEQDHGIVTIDVEHEANRRQSDEEVARIVELLGRISQCTVTDHEGATRPATLGDVLVVTPFNDQVNALRAALPEAVRVGTVDKFQGQEAPLVIVSLTSSSIADAPRGVGFLLDLHRLNVAVSRAQALTLVVGSPRLRDHLASSPVDVRRLNALCATQSQP